MSAALRADALDFLDAAHDDELPGYDEATAAPAYDAPVASSYRIITNSFRVFSKKPEMEVLHTSHDMRQRNIAALCYDNDGGFPWRPRAHFDYTSEDGLRARYDMESLNFEDWSLTVGDKTYVWTLEMRPMALCECERGSNRVTARFKFSEKGVLALRGAEARQQAIQPWATGRDEVYI